MEAACWRLRIVGYVSSYTDLSPFYYHMQAYFVSTWLLYYFEFWLENHLIAVKKNSLDLTALNLENYYLLLFSIILLHIEP